MTAIIHTERLRLRRYTPDDADPLFEVFADPYARRFYPRMADRDMVADWIALNLRNYDDFGFGLWAVEPLGEARLIGDCGLTWQPVEGKKLLEIGYHIHAAERGRGFATEAAKAALTHARDRIGANFVCSIVHPDNTASGTVAGRVHSHRREYRNAGEARLLYYTEHPSRDAALPSDQPPR